MTVQKIIPSYLYQEYSDDDDLQAFVAAFNEYAQEYLDYFNSIDLPIYTGPLVSGALLDWVAQGLYGLSRPSLPFGVQETLGPYNTWDFNTTLYNAGVAPPAPSFTTSDDVFRRIITWHFFKGDGRMFTIRWLKRRVMRFLLGTDGINFDVDQTYRISVTFTGSQCDINILNHWRRVLASSSFNAFKFNTIGYNGLKYSVINFIPFPLASIFKAAVDTGALELPFQFTYVVGTV